MSKLMGKEINAIPYLDLCSNIPSLSNGLDPDYARCFVGLDLDRNFLQK